MQYLIVTTDGDHYTKSKLNAIEQAKFSMSDDEVFLIEDDGTILLLSDENEWDDVDEIDEDDEDDDTELDDEIERNIKALKNN